jgi:hypothetical protein
MDSYLDMKHGVEYPLGEVLAIATDYVLTQEKVFAVSQGVGVWCQTRPNGNVLAIGLFKVMEEDDLKDYKAGFYILMEYFDSIADEEKPIVDEALKKLGL